MLLHLFDFFTRRNIRFLIVPLEALVVGGASYARGLFHTLGVDANVQIDYEARADVNQPHHEWILGQPSVLGTGDSAGKTDRARAFAKLVDADRTRIVEVRGYPDTMVGALEEASEALLIENRAPIGWTKRRRREARDDGRTLRVQGQTLATVNTDALFGESFRLVAPNLEVYAGCNSQSKLAAALTNLARLVGHADSAVIETHGDEPGRLTARFLEAVLTNAQIHDRTEVVPAAPDIGRQPAGRPNCERRVIEIQSARLVPPTQLDDSASSYAAQIWKRRCPDAGVELPALPEGSTIDFSARGTGAAYQRAGWGAPERAFTWTLGAESTLELPQNAANAHASDEAVELLFEAIAAVYPPERSTQALSVLVNGETVLDTRIEKQDADPIRASVPRSVWQRRDPVEVTLLHPDACTMKEIGRGEGQRPVAFALKTLQVRTETS